MRKWMRDRMRKKKPAEEGSQPAAPPLQPAYFDAEQAPPSAPESAQASQDHEPHHREAREESQEVEASPSREPEFEAPPVTDEPTAPSRTQAPAAEGQRARGRRRRGGRGRGGRGREQAVAQAFTPAAAKGIIPDAGQDSIADIDADAVPHDDSADADAAPAPQALETRAAKTPAAIPAAPSRPPKGIVVLAIGLPGSGKSSWFKRHNVVPLSTDMVRSLLFDDVREQRFQDLVFSNLRSMLKARLIAKRPMNYVDATNLTPAERQHWIKLAKDYNYEVHAIFFDVPLEVCVERHQRRDRVVPEDVMRRMASKLKAPTFPEGFAKITVVRVKKKDEAGAEE
jgi:predicted kinase